MYLKRYLTVSHLFCFFFSPSVSFIYFHPRYNMDLGEVKREKAMDQVSFYHNFPLLMPDTMT